MRILSVLIQIKNVNVFVHTQKQTTVYFQIKKPKLVCLSVDGCSEIFISYYGPAKS